jgi:ribosome maturation factor RimP
MEKLDKHTVEKELQKYLEENGLFLVDVLIDDHNHVKIEIDSMAGVNIEQCVKVTRIFESLYDRDIFDYSLEVSSPGLDAPFKTKKQWEKNIGKKIWVTTHDQKKICAVLSGFDEHNIIIKPVTLKKRGKATVEIVEDSETNIPIDQIKTMKKYIKI